MQLWLIIGITTIAIMVIGVETFETAMATTDTLAECGFTPLVTIGPLTQGEKIVAEDMETLTG